MPRSVQLTPLLLLTLAGAALAANDIRVQDIARLQGQRVNKLMGYGLVVGLPGTGDGDKYIGTMRALAKLHERFHQPLLTDAEVKGNRSVAIVSVEAVIPEHGAREGQAVDVVVSAIGTAKSLRGGQLLTTPLQYAMFDAADPATQAILALAGGQLHLPDDKTPTRAVIERGAVLEADFIYSFVENGRITLVLDDAHAGWPWAHMVARAVNHELRGPLRAKPKGPAAPGAKADAAAPADPAIAAGPRSITVQIPPWELAEPARFISSVLRAPLFELPEPAARVTIDRTTGQVAFTSSVRVSPTILQIPGVGMIRVGAPEAGAAPDGAAPPAGSPPGTAPAPATAAAASTKLASGQAIGFDELFDMLSSIKVSPEQLIQAIEQLHRSGALHAQLQYK